MVEKIKTVREAIAEKKQEESLSKLTAEDEKKDDVPAVPRDLGLENLDSYIDELAELQHKLLIKAPEFLRADAIRIICNHYIMKDRTKEVADLVQKVLPHFPVPDNISILFYERVLSEAAPAEISDERRWEIEKEIRSELTDPIVRALELGFLYELRDELEEAVEAFKEVLADHEGITRPGL